MNELILDKLKTAFERNGYNAEEQMYDDNVWIMSAAVIPFEETLETADFLPYSLDDAVLRESYLSTGKPTHFVRVVLRTNGSYGLCEYVDGTDVYVSVDLEQQEADCLVWSDTWIEGPPKFEGGTILSSLAWCKRMAGPFYIQLEDPSTL
ncbi:hypothetical protein [Brevibacillus sp. HB2.2]|uniref:hypothetical protein n=1 Tax=Brevibacillus sp. HB2.2 TaxID=2738846 RepID=UPI00156B0379|nr:hypothetical protein [Brevibacillus sp. HB2.2]NRS50456.1 hypothetical protein [Brevibacillus sp. HB2.2]